MTGRLSNKIEIVKLLNHLIFISLSFALHPSLSISLWVYCAWAVMCVPRLRLYSRASACLRATCVCKVGYFFAISWHNYYVCDCRNHLFVRQTFSRFGCCRWMAWRSWGTFCVRLFVVLSVSIVVLVFERFAGTRYYIKSNLLNVVHVFVGVWITITLLQLISSIVRTFVCSVFFETKRTIIRMIS